MRDKSSSSDSSLEARLEALEREWRIDDPDDLQWSHGRLQCAGDLAALLREHRQQEQMKCDPPMHVWSGNNSMGEVFLHPCQCGQLRPVAPALPERPAPQEPDYIREARQEVDRAFDAAERPAPPEERDRLGKVRAYLIRISKKVTRPTKYGFQLVRRERDEGDIEYQIFADTEENGCQIAWVQSTRHDAEFIQACLAQAPLFAELLAALPPPAPPKEPDVDVRAVCYALSNIYTLARREMNRKNRLDGISDDRWNHVIRLAEAAGCQGRGVLRAALPTEITEGSVAPPAPPTTEKDQ